MKKIIIIATICLFIACGCIFKEKIYRTHEFLAIKNQANEKQLLLKGFVRYKFPCSDCENGYFFLTNAMNKPMSEQTVLAVNVAKEKLSNYDQVKVGQEILLRAEYHADKTDKPIISNEHGYFRFIYLIETK